ncbi:MAG: rhamnogalacturonan acetylesterase [Clostridia bacterium]|nr:rhamnogalacturonan acetylesterase [Clostridia bacterium]
MTIHICGDSTAATYAPEKAPITGWGQVIGEILPDVCFANHSIGGRSSKSFLSEGRLVNVEKELQPGDIVLIQFAHNDGSDLVWRHTDANTSFVNNLSIFVDTARLHGAIPVLLTHTPRRWWRDGELMVTSGDYAPAIRRLAMQRNVPLIDVLEEGEKAIRAMGEATSEGLFMNVAPGLYPAYPDGSKDNTHTQRAGAELFARIVADGLQKLGLI